MLIQCYSNLLFLGDPSITKITRLQRNSNLDSESSRKMLNRLSKSTQIHTSSKMIITSSLWINSLIGLMRSIKNCSDSPQVMLGITPRYSPREIFQSLSTGLNKEWCHLWRTKADVALAGVSPRPDRWRVLSKLVTEKLGFSQSSSLLTAQSHSATMAVEEGLLSMPSTTPQRMLLPLKTSIHTQPLMVNAKTFKERPSSLALRRFKDSLQPNLQLLSNLVQCPSVLTPVVLPSSFTNLELSPNCVELPLIMLCFSLDMELKKERTTGSSRTPGHPIGERTDTSEFSETCPRKTRECAVSSKPLPIQ